VFTVRDFAVTVAIFELPWYEIPSMYYRSGTMGGQSRSRCLAATRIVLSSISGVGIELAQFRHLFKTCSSGFTVDGSQFCPDWCQI